MRRAGCLGLVLGLLGIAALYVVSQGWSGRGPAPTWR